MYVTRLVRETSATSSASISKTMSHCLGSGRAGINNILKSKKHFRVATLFTSSVYETPEKSTCNGSGKVESETGKSNSGGGSGSQRDLVNFPRTTILERIPPTRFGFVPKEWFDFFYKKTGVTGGYMFLTGTLVYLLSKEYLVVNAEFITMTNIVCTTAFIQRYVPEISDFAQKKQEEFIDDLNESQEREKSLTKQNMEDLERQRWQMEGVASMLPEAKRENIYLQMEAAYRSYLQQTYDAVKNILDYQVEKTNIEQYHTKTNLMHWVTDQVSRSITPEIKQKALSKSIQDLKQLGAKSSK